MSVSCPRILRRAGALLPVMLAACTGDGTVQRDPAEGPSGAEMLLSDSAAADSVALASLPSGQKPDFDIVPQVTIEALRDSVTAYCQALSDAGDAEVRKRLKGQWPPGHLTVLFVRANRRTGELRRVELVRRPADGLQRGYIWDGDAGTTTAVEWKVGRQEPETYGLPEGTPTPRALRALGRRLLVLPCAGNTPQH